MRILDRKLILHTLEQEMEGTSTSVPCVDEVEERTTTGCFSSLCCCFRRSSSTLDHEEDEGERGCRALISAEGDSRNILPVRAYVSLKVPFLGCWPSLGRSHRLADFQFEDNESSDKHTSNTSQFDVHRLLKCGTKVSTSHSHIKVCVVTHRDRLVARIGLQRFLDELKHSGPLTCFILKVSEGIIELKLFGNKDIETSGDICQDDGKESRISLKEGEDQGTDTTDDAEECDQLLTQSSVHVEGVNVHSQDSTEVTPSLETSQDGQQEQEAEEWVHRAIHLAPRFRNRLAGPDECFLEYLRCHYLVLIYLENSRKKIHVKGVKKRTEECNLFIRDLLAKWRRDETEQTNMTDPSLMRLVH